MKTTKINIGLKACMAFVILAISIYCEKGNATEATDYSITSHWLTVPVATNKAVDVFYLYPTAWTSTNPNPEVCAIDNPSMLQQAPVAFSKQATAFEPIGNIFAPFYRQGNLTSNAPAVTAGIPTTDAMAAFDYYIQHFNNGRPFILAGHSQGANVLSNLLAQYMKTHPAVLARMIAAYVIGYPVTAQYLTDNPYLKFAEGPGDTGVIISYNTQAPDVPPGANPILWGMVGTVINPLTWTRSTTLATTNQGFGSFMPNSNGVYVRVPQYADARIDITHGVLICSTADTNALAHFDTLAGFGIYHNFDYPFYYYNIRENAANRTTKFLNKYYGIADPAMVANGAWTLWLSSGGYQPWGPYTFSVPGGVPLAADFDGDGYADPAMVANGAWTFWFSSGGYLPSGPYIFAVPGGEPIAADFDGDGYADPAMVANGAWTLWLSSGGYQPWGSYTFSVPSGVPLAADFDGDHLADPAMVANGAWTFWFSSDGYLPSGPYIFAVPGGVPLAADFDGDGYADPAMVANGAWTLWLSSGGYQPWGSYIFSVPGGKPIAANFDGQ